VPPGEAYIESFTRAVAEMDLPHRLSRHRPEEMVAVMVAHGAQDGVIPAAQAEQLAAALGVDSGPRLYRGVTHLDPLLNKIVVSDILEFISSKNPTKKEP
jgi:hypothetical protein